MIPRCSTAGVTTIKFQKEMNVFSLKVKLYNHEGEDRIKCIKFDEMDISAKAVVLTLVFYVLGSVQSLCI